LLVVVLEVMALLLEHLSQLLLAEHLLLIQHIIIEHLPQMEL
jgi:hypothetical protein